jgi:uncharacterized Zn-binding protein involved in type VI secretion
MAVGLFQAVHNPRVQSVAGDSTVLYNLGLTGGTVPPAARLSDMHTCPMVTPGVPPIPHVGGPILPPCAPTVLIGGLPAARVGDMALCVGPPDSIVMGSPTVLIGNMMAARMGDPTIHGGVIVVGCPTVEIGIPGSGSPGGAGGGAPSNDTSNDTSFENAIAGVCNVAQQAKAFTTAAAFGFPLCPI